MTATITVGINNFARRHTADSKFSHFEGNIEEVAEMVEAVLAGNPDALRPVPNRSGVFLVEVPASGFYSGVVKLTPETELRATYEARREGEQAFIQVEAVGGEKQPAVYVDICLYHRTALGASELSTDCEYEVVSINASAEDGGEEPPTPVAMARNFLGLPGGSPADYTARDFAEAIIHWSQRAMCG